MRNQNSKTTSSHFASPKTTLTHAQKAEIQDRVNGVRQNKLVLFAQEGIAFDQSIDASQLILGSASAMKVDLPGYETYMGLTKDSTVQAIASFVLTVFDEIVAPRLAQSGGSKVEELRTALTTKLETSDIQPTMKVSQIWKEIFGVENVAGATYGILFHGLLNFIYGEKSTKQVRYVAASKQNITLLRRYFFVQADTIRKQGDVDVWTQLPKLVVTFSYNPTSKRYSFLAIEEPATRDQYVGSFITRLNAATSEGTKKCLAMVENYGSDIVKHFPGLEINVAQIGNIDMIAMAWDAWLSSTNGHMNVTSTIEQGANMVKRAIRTVARVVDNDFSQNGDAHVANLSRELAMANVGQANVANPQGFGTDTPTAG